MGKQLHAPQSLEDIELNTSQKSQSVLTWAWEFRRREKIYSAHVMQLQPTLHCTRLYSKPAQRCCSGVAVQLQCTAPEQKSDTLFLNFTPEQLFCSRAVCNCWHHSKKFGLQLSNFAPEQWSATLLQHSLMTPFQKFALEQWICSGALLQQLRLFQNFAPEQCTGAKLQHLCAGLEYSLMTELYTCGEGRVILENTTLIRLCTWLGNWSGHVRLPAVSMSWKLPSLI